MMLSFFFTKANCAARYSIVLVQEGLAEEEYPE